MPLVDWTYLLILVLVFLPLERLLPMHPGQRVLRRDWLNDTVYLLVNGWIIKAGAVALILVGVGLLQLIVPEGLVEAVRSQPIWLQALQVLLIADLGFYLIHRLFHTVPWLWRFHAVHHSIEEMDWLAAHRVHPVDQILTKAGPLVPCFVLGYSEAALGLYAVLYQWHSVLLHANVRLHFGPLRWLVASPEFHHWHHSDHREAYNRNFAGQLALLDVLFRTAYLTRGRAPTRYGCSDPVPRTYGGQLLYPFRRWHGGRPPEGATGPEAGPGDAGEARAEGAARREAA
jgi:sterol desaturase/sphingolipid hydroxylase (fatty acid hydroxylase superfamily)